jgi:hypothetical protein
VTCFYYSNQGDERLPKIIRLNDNSSDDNLHKNFEPECESDDINRESYHETDDDLVQERENYKDCMPERDPNDNVQEKSCKKSGL